MATITKTLNRRQDSRWTQADGKEYKEANTIGQLAWQLFQYSKSLTTVMLWVGVFICGGGRWFFCVFIFFQHMHYRN